MRLKILIIEDEMGLADALCQIMKNENYSVMSVYDGEQGLYEAMTGIYDVILLDVMLPGVNGFDIVKELRANAVASPVLMLTAKSDSESKVMGLDLGANYYLTKPFDADELLACIRAITRTPGATAGSAPAFGDIMLKIKQGGILCRVTDKFVKVSLKELNMMELLIKNNGIILSKEYLADHVWGYDSSAEYNNVEVYISFLRKKLSFIGSGVKIKAVRGMGYSLEVENDCPFET